MWSTLELGIFGLVSLVAITEFFIPLIFNKPFFGSFRKVKPVTKVKRQRLGIGICQTIIYVRPVQAVIGGTRYTHVSIEIHGACENVTREIDSQ